MIVVLRSAWKKELADIFAEKLSIVFIYLATSARKYPEQMLAKNAI
jgi:hypothetical protein